ncbi:hypothetical protein J7K76_03180 [Candidatus Bipolaricaulota bacterium]|nr:hypothetical protein [Candidatus Bipolaricaulota bacterium]
MRFTPAREAEGSTCPRLPGLRYKGEVGANVAGFGSRDLKGLLGLERPMNKARIP